MQILNIKAENFKGIKLVEVEPQGTTTVVGGKNRAGKSSFLDAIAATLGGTKLCPKEPIRDGQDEAACEIKLDGDPSRLIHPCTVVRKWLRKKDGRVVSELEITTADGYRAPTPQTILNDVVGPLGFDPERFLRMKANEQAEVLRKLVGLDFSELDADRQRAFEKRTEVNRDSKTLKARFDSMPRHDDAPGEEVSVSSLMTELQRRQAVNRRNLELRGELTELQSRPKSWDLRIKEAEATIKDLQAQVAAAKDRIASHKEGKAKAEQAIQIKLIETGNLKDEDEAETQQEITDSETVNRKVRETAERARMEKHVEAERKKSEALSDRIKDIDAKKQTMREAAKWPVDGLGYDDSGVTLLDRPFDQASATEQREAAFGIVAALNPALRFAFIKDGSLLDDDSLADFARIAAEKGFQLFVERVGEGKECTVIISDGEVKPEEEDELDTLLEQLPHAENDE